MKNIWIEKISSLKNRPTNELALGSALFSPTQGKDGRDTYSNMRKVKEDDVVLHLVDNKFFIGSSMVKESANTKELKSTEWAGEGYYIKLYNFIKYNKIILLEDVLNDEYEEILSLIRTSSEVFYTKALQLRQGGYLTPCSRELITYIKFVAKTNIIHINKDLVYPDFTTLEKKLSNDYADIQLKNKNIGSSSGSYIEEHNKEVKNLKKDFSTKLNFNYSEELVRLPGGGDIDLVIGHEKTLFSIEYKSGRTGHSQQIIDFIGKNRKHSKY